MPCFKNPYFSTKTHFCKFLNANTCDSDLKNIIMVQLKNIQHTDEMTISAVDVSKLWESCWVSQYVCSIFQVHTANTCIIIHVFHFIFTHMNETADEILAVSLKTFLDHENVLRVILIFFIL